MGLPFPHQQCMLAFAASQVCGSGFVGDASHSCIFCGASTHFPLSFCSDCQENLGRGADPASLPCSHNTPADFPFGELAPANQTDFRSSSLLRLNSSRKCIFPSEHFCLVLANWVCGGRHRATRQGTGLPALQEELDPAAQSQRLQAPRATCGGCTVQDFTAAMAGVHPRFAILLQQAWTETPSSVPAVSTSPRGHLRRVTPPGITHRTQPRQPNAPQLVRDQRGLAACSGAGAHPAAPGSCPAPTNPQTGQQQA